jgi:hypothetical protein
MGYVEKHKKSQVTLLLKATRLSRKVENLKPLVQDVRKGPQVNVLEALSYNSNRTRGFPSPGFPRFGFILVFNFYQN